MFSLYFELQIDTTSCYIINIFVFWILRNYQTMVSRLLAEPITKEVSYKLLSLEDSMLPVYNLAGF